MRTLEAEVLEAYCSYKTDELHAFSPCILIEITELTTEEPWLFIPAGGTGKPLAKFPETIVSV